MTSQAYVESGLDVRRPLAGFNRPLRGEIRKDLSPKSAFGVLIADFVEFNHLQTMRESALSEILEVVDQVVVYYRSESRSLKYGSVTREFDNLLVYREVVQLFTEGERCCAPNSQRLFVNSPEGNMISLILRYRYIDSSRIYAGDTRGFISWLEGISPGLIRTKLRISSDVESISIPSYKLFSESTDVALKFILNALLRSNISDPFVPRQVDDLFMKCMRHRACDIGRKAELVRDWFYSYVDLRVDVLNMEVDSALARYLGGTFLMPEKNDEENGFDNIGLTLTYLMFTKNLKKLNEYMAVLPALVALPESSMELLRSNWTMLLALFCSRNHDLIDSVFSDFNSSFGQRPSSAWDKDSTPLHFGQLGIGLSPVHALIESGIIRRQVEEKLVLRKFLILALLYRFENGDNCLENLLFQFQQVKDQDTPFLGKLIFERIFLNCVFEENCDQSVIDSAVSLIDFFRDQQHNVKAEGLLFPSLCVADEEKIGEYFTAVNLLKFCGYEIFQEDAGSKALLIVDTMMSKGETRSGILLAKKIGLTSPVHELAVTRLLEDGFDKDIDIFIENENIEKAFFSKLLCNIVKQRLTVVLRCVGEDTGRLHGLIGTVVHDMDAFLAISVNPSVEANCMSWILEEDGFLSLLTACKGLLHHPYLSGADSREKESLLFVTNGLITVISEYR